MVLSHAHKLLPDLQYLKLANTAAASTLICTSITDGKNLQTELGRPKWVINCLEESKNFATQSRADREPHSFYRFPVKTYFECGKPMES